MSRELVVRALSHQMTAKVWTGNYAPVFPFTPQDVSIGAILPAMLYMFRWGHRRGRGEFSKVYSDAETPKPTIRSVARKLSKHSLLSGFDSELGLTILGDMLLASTLENQRRKEGHDEPVQRCVANHYLASWIDLPASVANLRGVPEMLVALLANQSKGEVLEPGQKHGRYPVGSRIEDNMLLRLFGPGMRVESEYRSDLKSDTFDENAPIAIDQLLAVRLAQMCGSAPIKASGKGQQSPILNQWPIARAAFTALREDLECFLEAYGPTMPRLSFLPMMESGLALSLTNILLSTIPIVEYWEAHGRVSDISEQKPWEIFADCSMAVDHGLRDASEQSFDLTRQRLGRLAEPLMYMRLLDFYVTTESEMPPSTWPPRAPDARGWLDLLGSLACGVHKESNDAERSFRKFGNTLAQVLEENDPGHPIIAMVRKTDNTRRRGIVLADALVGLMDRKASKLELVTVLNSFLMADQPNGLARRRRVTLRVRRSNQKTGDVISFQLSNTALEFLVHRHTRRRGKRFREQPLSLPKFLEILRDRYGICVDIAPPGMQVPSELLQRNRQFLERRLRDLGLLIGVNDAERMKRLRQRFSAVSDVGDMETEETAFQ